MRSYRDLNCSYRDYRADSEGRIHKVVASIDAISGRVVQGYGNGLRDPEYSASWIEPPCVMGKDLADYVNILKQSEAEDEEL